MGLLRGMARTAVVAGTATAVSNRVSRRQAERWQTHDAARQYEAEQAYAPPPPGYAQPAARPSGDPVTAELERLGDLRGRGLLTDDEFAAAKAKLLGI
ncbi:SHOCT domain-containing protein [Jiangella asiatica]|uniref:SHOCT domain-containing protein n=1 Tax=Jiangella asiatica TaxID=2530372 RepID=A0A4R5D7H5_9ACTN|nr:SHOCT domain-containing protein [Jiangella asiatica]TDE08607.1 SHOCT domain-containing protein [Jiangella asiatica]